MSTFSGILEEMTIEQIREFAPNVVVLPLGSTEPHGPALPYGTDTFTIRAIAEQATRLANGRGGRVLCYPTLPITLNNNFRAWPFACRMGVRTFMAMLVDILKQAYADGVRRACLINGHGGSTDAIRAAMREMAGMDDVPFVCLVNGWAMADDEVHRRIVENRSDHGGDVEASIQMHLCPDLAHADKLANNPENEPRLAVLCDPKVYFVRPWHRFVPASAGGDQRKASAEKGQALVESAAESTARLLLELSQAAESADFPY
jgi:creatinine amidohydrolase